MLNHFDGNQLVIVKQDDPPRQLLPDWQFEDDVVYPCTKDFKSGPGGSKITGRYWEQTWVDFYAALQAQDDETQEAAFRPGNFLVLGNEPHYWKGEGIPRFECLTTGGNIHQIKQIKKGAGVEVVTFGMDEPAPDAAVTNYKTDLRIAKFTALRIDGLLFNLFDDRDIYWPIRSPKPAWLPWEDVIVFPDLGNVTTSVNLNVRKQPGIEGELVDVLPAGSRVKLEAYFPSMGNIWALTAYGYIALRYQPLRNYYGHYYTTTWRLGQVSPRRPKADLPGPLPLFSMVLPAGTTNQIVINAFYRVYGWPKYWAKLVETGLAWPLVTNRQALYTGPLFSELGLLPGDEERLLLAVSYLMGQG